MPQHIDIEIDKLTNSIENRISGEVFNTEVIKMEPLLKRQIKKKDWVFDWKKELSDPEKEVYKLTTVQNPAVIQGLVSMEDKKDHIFMHLIESARFNRGKHKLYLGVPANLVAFVCKQSFDKGYDGFVAFFAKTKLIEHYIEILRAEVLYDNYMSINTEAAIFLVDRYFNK